MKIKLISLFLALTFCFVCAALVSCNDNAGPGNETTSGSETTNAEEETLPPPMEFADDDDLSYVFNADKTTVSVYGLFHESGAKKIEIPETHDGFTVTGIVSYAFSSMEALESISIPDTVTHIGSYAFDGCVSLADIDLSKNLSYLGEYAFEGCESLKMTEYDNAKYIGSKDAPYTVLYSAINTEIESCTVHNDTKIIYDYAFLECTEADEIILPNGLLQVGLYAFEECYDLFPNNHHNNAYYLGNDENPYLVLVRSSSKKELTEVAVESGTKIIAPGAFEGCSNLSSVTIPESVCFIGQYAFEGCESLTNLAIAQSSWTVIIDGENTSAPITESTSSEAFIDDLVKVYYYCSWIKQ